MKPRAGLYRVDRFNFKGHQPGTVFTATLQPDAEERAIRRGNITLLERIIPSIQPGTYTFPSGWLTPQEEKEQ